MRAVRGVLVIWSLLTLNFGIICTISSPTEHLGSSLDRGPHFRHAELGNGIQAMVPRSQNPDVLRFSQGEEDEENGMDQSKRLSRLHYVLQIGHPRSRGMRLRLMNWVM